jgi:hypothetical protein
LSCGSSFLIFFFFFPFFLAFFFFTNRGETPLAHYSAFLGTFKRIFTRELLRVMDGQTRYVMHVFGPYHVYALNELGRRFLCLAGARVPRTVAFCFLRELSVLYAATFDGESPGGAVVAAEAAGAHAAPMPYEGHRLFRDVIRDTAARHVRAHRAETRRSRMHSDGYGAGGHAGAFGGFGSGGGVDGEVGGAGSTALLSASEVAAVRALSPTDVAYLLPHKERRNLVVIDPNVARLGYQARKLGAFDVGGDTAELDGYGGSAGGAAGQCADDDLDVGGWWDRHPYIAIVITGIFLLLLGVYAIVLAPYCGWTFERKDAQGRSTCLFS